MKTLAQFLEARMLATADFKVSASGRKVRRLIKVGDDDYNKADDTDKDGDVDADDMKRRKMLAKEETELEEKISVVSGNAPRKQGRFAPNDQTRTDKTSIGRVATGTLHTGNKKPGDTSVHDKAKARLAKMNEETAGETYEHAHDHLLKAKAAKEGSQEYHFHMSNHHEAMGHWHTAKGRNIAADKEFNKAEAHHEFGINVKESVEQIDEISDKTLSNYVTAARKDREHNKVNKSAPDTAQKVSANERDKKRIAGMNKAKSYLTPGTAGHAKNQARRAANEETELAEATTVKSAKYSWGTMKTVHHGKDFSIPLHPEHHKPIAALKHGESHSFKDETGNKWKATREDDTVHFHGGSYGTQKTSVKHDTMKESVNEVTSSGNAQHALANSEHSKHAAYMKKTHGVETKYHGTDELSYHGDKASVKKALINHYDDEEEAKALHPKAFKESYINEESEHLVHVSDGSKYDEEPHPKDVEHVMAGVKKHGGSFDGHSDKGAFFKFKSHSDASSFKKHVDSCPNRSCSADHMNESVEHIDEATDKHDARLLQLARLGLLDKSDIAVFRTAVQTLKADKQLSIKQRNILLSVYESLVNLVTGDDALFNRTKIDLQREETQAEGYYKDIDTDKKETERLSGSWKVETPWRKIKPGSDTVTDKSGAKHGPMSRVRHLARLARAKSSKEGK